MPSMPPAELRKKIASAVYPAKDLPFRARIVEEKQFRGYVRKKVLYQVEKNTFRPAWLCHPLEGTEGMPAIFCCHGHGPGKDPLVGLFRGKRCLEYHKLVSVRLARAGFVTLTPDRRGYGDSYPSPNGYPSKHDLKKLNDNYLKERDMSLFLLDVSDALRGLQFLIKWAGVGKNAIGCIGIESGAPVAACVSALDERIRSVCLSAFMTDNERTITINSTFSIDAAAFSRLIVPRLMQIQIPQATASASAAYTAVREIEKCYRLAECRKSLRIYRFDGVVEIDYGAAERFFLPLEKIL